MLHIRSVSFPDLITRIFDEAYRSQSSPLRVQSLLFSCYLIYPRSKDLPQHPFLEHPSLYVRDQVSRPYKIGKIIIRSLIFWDVPQRRFIDGCRRFGMIYLSHLLEDGTDMLCRNVGNYQSTLRNIPEVRTSHSVTYPGISSRGGVQQIQLRTEDRENGDLGAVAPCQGFWRQLLFGTRNFISCSKILLIFGTLRLFMMTTNLFVIANVKQLRT